MFLWATFDLLAKAKFVAELRVEAEADVEVVETETD